MVNVRQTRAGLPGTFRTCIQPRSFSRSSLTMMRRSNVAVACLHTVSPAIKAVCRHSTNAVPFAGRCSANSQTTGNALDSRLRAAGIKRGDGTDAPYLPSRGAHAEFVSKPAIDGIGPLDGQSSPSTPNAESANMTDTPPLKPIPSSQQHIKVALTDLAARLFGALPHTTTGATTAANCTAPKYDAASTEQIKAVLDQWADEYFPADDAASGLSGPQAAATPSPEDTSLACALNQQQLRIDGGKASAPAAASGPVMEEGNGLVGRALIAAAVAAASGESAGRAGNARKFKPLKVTAVKLGANVTAPKPDGGGPAATTSKSSSNDTTPAALSSFDVDAWAAAAAKEAACNTQDVSSNASHETTPAHLNSRTAGKTTLCWTVQALAQAVAAYNSSICSATSSGLAEKPAAAATEAQHLLEMTSTEAITLLLQLQPAQRAGLLLVLLSSDTSSYCDSKAPGPDWFESVVCGVSHRLGLLELGVLLAAVHHRFGFAAFTHTAQQLLPLTDPTDPYLTQALGEPQPAAALQALLLHWLLLPQLAAAGLPVLPDQLLLRLLSKVVGALSQRQLQLAGRWNEVWPIVQLASQQQQQQQYMAGSATATVNGTEACGVQSTWCGLTGINSEHIARIISSAALVLKQVGGGSTKQQQKATAAAAAQLRAVVRAVLMGLAPLQPMMLVVMHELLLLPQSQVAAAVADSASQSAAAVYDKLQLLQLVLEAGSNSPLKVPSFAELVDQSFSILGAGSLPAQDSISNNSSSDADASSRNGYYAEKLKAAATAVLSALPPERLREELLQLLELQQSRYLLSTSPALRSSTAESQQQQQQHVMSAEISELFVNLAEQAGVAIAAVLLDVLPMPIWATAWTIFAGPATGTFCWTRQQIVAVLAGMPAEQPALCNNSSSQHSKLQAAWAVVCAHFTLNDVHMELTHRTAVRHVSTDAAGQQQQVQQTGTPATAASAASAAAASAFRGTLGQFVADTLHHTTTAPAAAAHIAALVQVLPVDAFVQVSAHILPPSAFGPSVATYADLTYAYGASATAWGGAGSPLGAGPADVAHMSSASSVDGVIGLQKCLLRLYSSIPELPDAPVAVQLLAAVAALLPIDRLPALLTAGYDVAQGLQRLPWPAGAASTAAAAAVSDAEFNDCSSSGAIGVTHLDADVREQFELLVAAAAAERDSAAVHHILSVLVQELHIDQAQLVLDVLGGGVSDAAAAAAQSVINQRISSSNTAGPMFRFAAPDARSSKGLSSVDVATGFEGEMIWQLGQNAVQSESSVAAVAATARDSNAVAAAAKAAANEADWRLVNQVLELVEAIPAALPPGTVSMDALHDPSHIASTLQQLLSKLVTWSPSCPSAAAAVAALLNKLVVARAWSAAETGAVLQRLPLATALQLLLESDTSSSSNSFSSNRRKLLAALVDWHGCDDAVGMLRELFVVDYKHASIASFAALLADLQPAVARSSSSSSVFREVHGKYPNYYIAAVMHVLGLMRGLNNTNNLDQLQQQRSNAAAAAAAAGSCSDYSSIWTFQLARVLSLLAVLVPDHVTHQLSEAVGRSFPASSSSSTTDHSLPAAAAGGDWQQDLAQLLATLPSAAAATASKGYDLWGPVAAALCSGAAAASNGVAVLPALRLAVVSSSSSSNLGTTAASTRLAVHLPMLLQQLQNDGLLTCGLGLSSSSSTTLVPSCIKLQLMHLLKQLYRTDKALTLSQALDTLAVVAPTLDKTLAYAVVYVVGHPKARGYSTAVQEHSEALQAMEAAVAAAALPTGAAVPAAVVTAARQLADELAYCHELVPGHTMARLMSAMAAVLPWSGSTTTAGSKYAQDQSSTDISSPVKPSYTGSGDLGFCGCPAETLPEDQGWQGVTQLYLIQSSLLTASCAMWGFDKGTVVAQGLITKLTSATTLDGMSAAAQVGSSSGTNGSSGTTSGVSGGISTHAHRAEAALLKTVGHAPAAAHAADVAAAIAVEGGATHAAKATAALLRAAATGGSSSSGDIGRSSSSSSSTSDQSQQPHYSQAQRAQQAILLAAASGSGSSSSNGCHARLAEQKLMSAAFGPDQTSSSSGSSGEVLWAVQSLQTAAQQLQQQQPQSSSAPQAHAAASAVVRSLLCNAVDTFAVDSQSTAAEALLAVLPRMMLPDSLTVQVLVQTQGLVTNTIWAQGLHATVMSVAAAAGDKTGNTNALLQLLLVLVQEVQLQLRVNAVGPQVYADIMAAAADCTRPEDQARVAVQQLLQLMLTGCTTEAAVQDCQGFRGVALSASAAAQLVIELSKCRAVPNSSSSRTDEAVFGHRSVRQLSVVSMAAQAILKHFTNCTTTASSGSSNSSSLTLVVSCIADQLYQTALLPQLYLILLLHPHLTGQQLNTLVRQSALCTGNTPEAVRALNLLCNTVQSGKQLPLGAYAQILATALDVVNSDKTVQSTMYHEQRVGLELGQMQRQQQLLSGVIAVLGAFRGLRTPYSSPLGAQIVLPIADLAAALCYSWELLPSCTARSLSASVATAVASSGGHDQLRQLLAQLPNAAAAGFSKGKEVWVPLLQHMATAGGLSEAEESDLIARLEAVAPKLPICIPRSSDQADEEGPRFADPAAVTAALAGPRITHHASAPAGKQAEKAAGTDAVKAAISSQPDSAQATTATSLNQLSDRCAPDQSIMAETADVSDDVLDTVAAASLAVATTVASAALAAGYGAAGALVGLVWGVAAVTAGALAAAAADHNSYCSTTSSSGVNAATTSHDSTDATATSSTDTTTNTDIAPESPKTPTSQDIATIGVPAVATTYAAGNQDTGNTTCKAVMGGRSKSAAAPAATVNIKHQAMPGVIGTAGLGSLAAEDPHEVVRKIKTTSCKLPVDEAVMQVVPLLLQPGSSSSPWPLLALNAVLHAKHPAMYNTLAGNSTPLNLALAATLSGQPDAVSGQPGSFSGPLDAVLQASDLLAKANSRGHVSIQDILNEPWGLQDAAVQAALVAAEAVHPWPVAMELCQRLINSLWQALMGCSSAEASGALSPDGSAAAWQTIVTDLLSGTKPDVALQLLSGFIAAQYGWEAGCRAVAVAAALDNDTISSSKGPPLLPRMLKKVCKRYSYPPVSFLTMLLQHKDVKLSAGGTAIVLDEAVQQLLSQYGTVRKAEAVKPAGSSSAADASSQQRGEFDPWGFDALFNELDLFSDQPPGPHYRSTSQFTAANSSTNVSMSQQVLVTVRPAMIKSVEHVARAAAAKGHAVEAVDFVMKLLLTTVLQESGEQAVQGAVGLGVKADQGVDKAAGVAAQQQQQLVLVMNQEQVKQVLALAADCCCMALDTLGSSGDGADNSGKQGAAAGVVAVIPELLSVLAATGNTDGCIKLAVAVCRGYQQQHKSKQKSTLCSAWLVGWVVTTAAATVEASEGDLSPAEFEIAAFWSQISAALFGKEVPVEQCLVILAAVAEHLPLQLGLRLVSVSHAKLYSVMPQAVAIVHSGNCGY